MAGGTRSFEMARRLVEMGHQVNMVTSWRERDDRAGWFETEEAGIRVHWLPVPYSNHMSNSRRIKAFFTFAIGAARKAAALPADVVFATSTPLTIALPGIFASRNKRVPMVFEVRDLWPQVPIALGALTNPLTRSLAIGLEKLAYRHSAAIVALAPGMKEGVAKTGYPEDLISVIPNGADFYALDCISTDYPRSLRAENEWLGQGPVFVYSGAFGFVNDVDYMVELAEICLQRAPHFRFVAIGDGARWGEIKAKAASRGVLDKNFHLLGSLPKATVFRWLAESDGALVLYKGPEIIWRDCVSNKLFDAMAAGKPIISNIPGWGPLLCEEAGAGLIMDRNDAEQGAKLLVERTSQGNWIRDAAQASRRLAQGRFDRDQLARQLETVLLSVVKQ